MSVCYAKKAFTHEHNMGHRIIIVVFGEAKDRCILCMMSVIDGTEGSHMNIITIGLLTLLYNLACKYRIILGICPRGACNLLMPFFFRKSQ